jgi:toxin YoeB
MEIELHPKAIKDKIFWKTSGNKQVMKKIDDLVDDIIEHPETGIGRPEPLKHELSGLWSRHINDEHRIVYEVKNNKLHIISLKGHYEK